MEKVLVNTNYLRLLGKTFMHLQPLKAGQVVLGGKYHCVTAEYGEVGQIELLHRFECSLYDLKPVTMLLSEGDADCRQRLKDTGLMGTDLIQVCTFRFIRRYDTQFTEIIDAETRRAGLVITRQPSIF